MDLFTTLMVVTVSGSALFCLLTIWRIVGYNRKYNLPESRYTKLFGITKKGHFVVFYISMVLVNIICGLWVAFAF